MRLDSQRGLFVYQSYDCLRSIHAQAISCTTIVNQRVPTSQTLPEAYNCHSQATDRCACCTSSSPIWTREHSRIEKCGDPLGAERAPPPSSRIAQRDRRYGFEKDRDSTASLLCVYREPYQNHKTYRMRLVAPAGRRIFTRCIELSVNA